MQHNRTRRALVGTLGLWFRWGEGAEELLLRQAECDSDVSARTSFKDMTECLAANEGLWWKI